MLWVGASYSKEEGRIESQLIAAFVPPGNDGSPGATGGGNLCEIFMLADAPGESVKSGKGTTTCQSWPTTHQNLPVIAVSCRTQDGQAIQCCGHGLLAAAHSWQLRRQCNEVSLLMNNSVIPSRGEQQIIWLQFSRLHTKRCAVPGWAERVFPGQPQPIAAAICGNEQGYWVLQWPDGFDLHGLSHPTDDLSKMTQRALICTSAQPAQADDAIQLRYFAPQYGVPEDDATGSALRVLADYWSPRTIVLTARQCSERGGLLLARSTQSHVEIGGRCKIMEA